MADPHTAPDPTPAALGPAAAASRRAVLRWGAALAAAACAPKGTGSGDGAGDDDSGGGDSGAAPTPTRAPEPPRWEPPGPADDVAFPWGVQTGDALPDAVIVRVRALQMPLRVEVVRAEGDGWVADQQHEQLWPPDGAESIRVELTGLRPDTAYCLAAQDAMGRWSRSTRLRTALADGALRVLTLGATSCLGGNEPWRSLSVAAGEDLDAFLLLGDTVYADGSRTMEDYRLFWRAAMRVEGMRALTSSTSVVATWDDHEVDNNWSRSTLEAGQFANARAAFAEALPQREGPGGTGIWRQLRWGDTAELFVLDCRGEREDGLYVSEQQLAWLEDALAASTARFKLILNSVPITDLTAMFGAAAADDRWQGYPSQRERILRFIDEQPISGVLWVTGDVHFPAICSVSPPGAPGAGQTEVFTGPGGSFLNLAADLFVGDPQYPYVGYAWNWCRLRLDPGTGVVDVTFVDDAGGVLHSASLQL